MAAITAFREPNLVLKLSKPEDFTGFESRRNRYEILWGFYDNTVYNEIHTWARQFKLSAGLYEATRSIYSPAYRLGNFHTTHLMGGLLDPEAGDGTQEETALPIITGKEKIRPAIANIWRWSNWQSKKTLYTRYGAVMGDSAIRVVDSVRHGKVFLEVIHPKLIKDLDKDEFGNVKAYVLEEERPDPRKGKSNNTVTYTEIVQRGAGEDVVFQTFLDNSLYPWNFDENDDPMPEWVEPYGFIPFVHALHIDVGLDYGWAEMQALITKFNEINDEASKVHDLMRKELEGTFLITGMKKPATDTKIEGSAPSRDRPFPGREEMKNLYAPAGVTATSLSSNADINAGLATVVAQGKEIEKELPELMYDESGEIAALSGKALRIRQQPITSKIGERRVQYDSQLVAAQQMALSIGAMRKYPGFEGIGTFKDGDFEHHIGKRPVFKVDRVDELEEDRIFWETAQIALSIPGVEAAPYLRRQGWSDEEISDLLRDGARRQSLEARRNARVTDAEIETSQDIIEEAETEAASE